MSGDCQARSESLRKIWTEWAQNYLEERSKNFQKKINNPKYTLLNFIAKQIQQ